MYRRLLVVTLTVALLAALGTALALAGLARSVDAAAARNALQAQAERLALASPSARELLVESLSGVDGELVAHVPPRGEVVGSAAELVPPRVVRQLRRGEAVSTVARADGQIFLVEAWPTAEGGGIVTAQDAESVRSLSPTVLLRILLAFAAGLAVAAVGAAILARRLSLPLTTLAGRAQRLAAGERGTAPGASGIAEIDRVEAALDSLDAALTRSEGRQREFLLSISHEIRTPLTAVRGYAEALADGVVEPADLGAVGATLAAETARLTAFTDDLLSLARLEADDFSLDLVDGVSVARIAQDLAVAWRARAAEAQVDIVVEPMPDTPTLRTDPHRLRQVIDGLVENALRVSPPHSHITISAGPLARGVRLSVADQGPGLTADDAAHAFERSVLRDRYRDSRPVGSGLGLSISARLVARLGGTIRAESGDVGAVFRIDLPWDAEGPLP